ncbi:MAG: hypothetical protein U0264_10935 [Candidatus Kapaibacterium sp.]
MSKLACVCGHIIVDQTDNLIYKAHFVREQDVDSINGYLTDIAAFILAIRTGERDKWLVEYFGTDIYKTLSDGDVVHDIILRYSVQFESMMYICEKCGRIQLQKGKENTFISFVPEESNWQSIFNGLSRR